MVVKLEFDRLKVWDASQNLHILLLRFPLYVKVRNESLQRRLRCSRRDGLTQRHAVT